MTTAPPAYVSMSSVTYEQIKRRARERGGGCATDHHIAFTTTDRDGVWFWACYRCPATREQGVPSWRTPC
jgi:hypothetical protein